MRVSGVFKQQTDVEPEVIPAARVVPWAAVGVLILLGLILYFRYGSRMTPLL